MWLNFTCISVGMVIGLAGTFGAAAAPASGTVIGTAQATLSVQQVRCGCEERRRNGACELRACAQQGSAEISSAKASKSAKARKRSKKAPSSEEDNRSLPPPSRPLGR